MYLLLAYTPSTFEIQLYISLKLLSGILASVLFHTFEHNTKSDMKQPISTACLSFPLGAKFQVITHYCFSIYFEEHFLLL